MNHLNRDDGFSVFIFFLFFACDIESHTLPLDKIGEVLLAGECP